MAIQTDQTLTGYVRNVRTLGEARSAAVFAIIESVQRSQRASDDVTADATPHIFRAIVANGADARSAAFRCIQSAQRNALRDAHDDVSLDSAPDEGWQRDALEAAIQAAGLGRDDIAKSYGSGSRTFERMTLSDALDETPDAAAALLRAIIAGHIGKAANRDYEGSLYVHLNLVTVSAIAGLDAPKSKVDRLALQTLCADAFGVMQAIREGDQSRSAALAAAALAYVRRNRRAAPSRSGSVIRSEGVANYADMLAQGPAAPFQRAIGARVNTGGKGRSGPACGQPAQGLPYGTTGQYVSGNRSTLATVAAAKANALVDSESVSLRVDAARLNGAPCKVQIAQGTGEPMLCGCGSLRGSVLVSVTHIIEPNRISANVTRSLSGKILTGADTYTTWHHALPLCAIPVVVTAQTYRVVATGEARDGSLMVGSHRCGCGSKRGLLTDSGAHMRK